MMETLRFLLWRCRGVAWLLHYQWRIYVPRSQRYTTRQAWTYFTALGDFRLDGYSPSDAFLEDVSCA